MQLANTPPLQSTTPGLHPVSFHQMAPPVRGNTHPITAYYSVYRPRKDERLSRPGWLVTYQNKVPPPGVEPGHVTDPSTNRARRRVTSLIRPTPLPLCHATKRYAVIEQWMIHFAAYTAAETASASQLAEQPAKLSLPIRESRPPSLVIQGSLAHKSWPRNSISISSAIFAPYTWDQHKSRYIDRCIDRHTDTQTMLCATSVATGRILLTQFLFLVYLYLSFLCRVFYCATLSWPYRQLLSARKYTVLYFMHWVHAMQPNNIVQNSTIFIQIFIRLHGW